VLAKAARWTGWTLIAFGVLVLLYLVYLMFFTDIATNQAQQDLLEEWELNYGSIEELPGEGDGTSRSDEPADAGDAYAVMWFERPGSDERPVTDKNLFVVEGVDLSLLERGPGHYPTSAAPGQDGNFAIAGHRTTYARPFYNLDKLRDGDRVHVIDRDRREWVYEFREQQIVYPTDTWVIDPDPLQTGAPTLTLTTCHPRFSAAQRLVAFFELVEGEA
jgi:sortase A